MSKQKLNLAENPKFLQFVEQDFSVVEKDYDTWTSKKVQVVGYCNPKETIECHLFAVEVVKDYEGFITYIVKGKGTLPKSLESDRDVWIMRTDDFNKAYDLKMRLSSLVDGHKPSEREKMHCYGSLQREKTMWE